MSATRSAPHRPGAEPTPWVMTPSGLVVVEKQQLAEPARRLSKLCTAGRMMRLTRGVYLPLERVPLKPWENFRLRCEALHTLGSRVLGGAAAAAMHGLWLIDSAPENVETYCMVKPGRRSRREGEVVIHGPLPEHHVEKVHKNFPFTLKSGAVELPQAARVTTVARTLIDIYRYLGPASCFVATCSALRNQLVTREELLNCAADCKALGLRRIKGFTKLIDAVFRSQGFRLDSAVEAIFLAQITLTGYFSVQVQVPFTLNGQSVRVDFLLPDAQLVIELDGLSKYGSKRIEQYYNLEKEKQRADLLQNMTAYTVVRFNYQQVMSFEAFHSVLMKLGLDPNFHKPSQDFMSQFRPGYRRK